MTSTIAASIIVLGLAIIAVEISIAAFKSIARAREQARILKSYGQH